MRYLRLITLLLASIGLSAAQTPSSNMPDADKSYGQDSSNQRQMAGTTSADHTIEGCLSGADGNYTLSDKNGVSYRLTGDTAKLSEHIGHEVKVSGNKSSAPATSSADTMGQTGGAQQAIEVKAVKHIAKKCTSGGAPNAK